MSTTDGDDVPRDPWGNPLPPEDRPPANPRPEDFPPPFPSDPPGGAPPFVPPPSAPRTNPAWPGSQPTEAAPTVPTAPPAPPANPAWPGAQPSAPPPPPPPYAQQPQPQPPHLGQPYPPGAQGPGWGGPGVPPQGPYPPGWGAAPPWGPPRRDGGAVGALVCAIVGLLCLGIVLEPVALVLGLLARKRIRESNGTLTGEGLATAAIVIGIVGLVLAIISFVWLAANPDAIDDLLSGFTTTTGG